MDEDGNPVAETLLLFGAPFDDPKWSDPLDWHDVIARAKGWITNLPKSATPLERHTQWVDSRKKLEVEPCKVVYAGTEFTRHSLVCLRSSLIKVQCYDLPVSIKMRDITQEQIAQLTEFCQLLKVEPTRPFGWYLAAFYG